MTDVRGKTARIVALTARFVLLSLVALAVLWGAALFTGGTALADSPSSYGAMPNRHHVNDLPDDAKVVGKCTYKVAGAKAASRLGGVAKDALKTRKVPKKGDILDAVSIPLRSNPYVLGLGVIACSSVGHADPAY